MFWKRERRDVEQLRRQVEADAREREAARLNLQRSTRRLARFLEGIPLDSGLASIGNDLIGNPEKK
jgi:hypothetical protein